MARQQQFETFLPSGAVERARAPELLRHHSEPMISPKALTPRTGDASYIPRFQGSSHISNSNCMSPLSSPHPSQPSPSNRSSQNQNGQIISPPISRSGSSDGKTVELVEDWRVFTRRLREQFLGEKAHMEADRVRAEEVMAEERALWDKERACYERRIAELELQLAALIGPLSQTSPLQSVGPIPTSAFPFTTPAFPPTTSVFPPRTSTSQAPNTGATGKASKSNGLDSNSSPRTVPQESGRNPDGSPFYAPASHNPSRTFESAPSAELRVDSISHPLETPLRVTSKELTQSDFVRTPARGTSEASTPEREGSVVGDSIDISLIQPELEGVAIKSSAVSLTFAAKVLSPSGMTMSPSILSPDIMPPARPVQSYDRRVPASGRKKTLEIIKQPEGRRLTMHAGHTPNHSVISFELGDSGLTTPKAPVRNPESEVVVERVQVSVEDPELKGPLGLTNDAPEDDRFLAALTSKLEEVAENAVSETSEESVAEQEMNDAEMLKTALHAIGRGSRCGLQEDDEGSGLTPGASTDDIPVLRLKQSTNFGRPLGSL